MVGLANWGPLCLLVLLLLAIVVALVLGRAEALLGLPLVGLLFGGIYWIHLRRYRRVLDIAFEVACSER